MPKIRCIIIPRINYKQSYIHVGKQYEGRTVKMIRDESISYPNQFITAYSVYDEDNELICTVSCPNVVYYYSAKEIGVS